MKKTYVTTMPDHIGAFLKASRCFAQLGVNITRVSYNKAVDSHTLFIDAEGTREQLERADEMLTEIGYLRSPAADKSVILLEFRLRDVPGAVTDILTLIDEFRFNISYISSQENGSDHQLFKMGLFVDDPAKIAQFMARAEKICPVRPIDYNRADKVYDNSIFYQSFVSSLAGAMDVTDEKREELLVNTNLAMQTLDERGLSPYRTFDSISRFAELLSVCRGDAFQPRVTRHQVTENTEITLIEPPCGSNTAILRHGEETLFIDSGYACYQPEMLRLLRQLLPDWDAMHKRILITHADVDHCGLLPLFDEIIASRKSAECLRLEYEGGDGFREQNALHKPYIRICKVLTGYGKADPAKVTVPWNDPGEQTEALRQIGFFDFADLHFEVYEGKGGHLPGEIVLIDYRHHVVFTGDVYVNLKGMTAEQARYNQYAPILMTSVDTDPALCADERRAVMQRLGAGAWKIFGAHGCMKEYELKVL
ncbi:MAG: MBL fold metallo-hydrolase [Clostridia bacterium]|nr:MBL fold metallo-hydrolase [Clostridia bacterium]